jgi:hypothetical protein
VASDPIANTSLAVLSSTKRGDEGMGQDLIAGATKETVGNAIGERS